MAGIYNSAADALGVNGEPVAETGFKASEAINALTGTPQNDPKWVPDSPPPREPATEQPEKSFLRRTAERYVGDAEALATLATGAVAQPVGAVVGLARGLMSGYGTKEGAQEGKARAAEVAQSLTYQPRSEAGQERVAQIGKVIDTTKIGGLGPAEGVSLAGVLAGPRAVKPAAPAPVRAVPQQMASVGAAGVAPLEQARAMAAPYPVLQAAVEQAGKKIDLNVLRRHVEAESLPVPVKLTT